MPNNINELREPAQATSIKLNLSQFAIEEKDFYILYVIRTLTSVDDQYFSLVFQGRASLPKDYQVIKLLPEDVNIRDVPQHNLMLCYKIIK